MLNPSLHIAPTSKTSLRTWASYLWVILLSLPFVVSLVVSDELMNGVMGPDGRSSAKMFAFLGIMSIIGICVGVHLVFRQKPLTISLNRTDLCLLIFLLYCYIRYATTPYPAHGAERLLTWVLLGILYFFWKYEFTSNSGMQEANAKMDDSTTSYPISIFIFSLLLFALIQNIYGLLQLYEVLPSLHHRFKVTGSFGNPGPYAAYIASVLPFALGLYLYRDQLDFGRATQLIQVLAVAVCVSCLLILPTTHARAAWLGALGGVGLVLAYRYQVIGRLRNLLNRPWKVGMLMLGVLIILASLAWVLYHFKPDSALGRLLIWEVSLNMMADAPIFGQGFDRFAAEYGNWQAAYFAAHPEADAYAWVAGSAPMAFNELLQLGVELGVVGLLLIIGWIWLSIIPVIKHVSAHPIIYPALASVVGVLMIAMFSYPFQVTPILINLMFLMALIASHSPHEKTVSTISHKAYAKYIVAIVCIGISISLMLTQYPRYQHYQQWQDASLAYQRKNYARAATIYEQLSPNLKDTGLFLVNHGKVLAVQGKHAQSIEILEAARLRYSDPYLFTTLGGAYEALGQHESAEKYLQHATHLIPHKLYPRYLQAKLYRSMGKSDEAVHTAQTILAMKPKIRSTATDEIQVEMQALIEQYP